jgi:phosphoribosyl-AMP cyclohydrolase
MPTARPSPFSTTPPRPAWPPPGREGPTALTRLDPPGLAGLLARRAWTGGDLSGALGWLDRALAADAEADGGPHRDTYAAWRAEVRALADDPAAALASYQAALGRHPDPSGRRWRPPPPCAAAIRRTPCGWPSGRATSPAAPAMPPPSPGNRLPRGPSRGPAVSPPAPDPDFLAALKWTPDGLIPAIVQDAATGEVLMMAWMDRDAVRRTLDTGQTHFYSRSRRASWHKGGTSGHVQHVEAILVDCDSDVLLIRARQIGGACHEGYRSCFFRRLDAHGRLEIVATPVFAPGDVYGSGG